MTTPPPEITYEPSTYYDLTARCINSACPVYDQVFQVGYAYSNANALCVVFCGICDSQDEILTATVMDPQPVQE